MRRTGDQHPGARKAVEQLAENPQALAQKSARPHVPEHSDQGLVRPDPQPGPAGRPIQATPPNSMGNSRHLAPKAFHAHGALHRAAVNDAGLTSVEESAQHTERLRLAFDLSAAGTLRALPFLAKDFVIDLSPIRLGMSGGHATYQIVEVGLMEDRNTRVPQSHPVDL